MKNNWPIIALIIVSNFSLLAQFDQKKKDNQLELPFFDDFSLENKLSSERWEESDVIVNNSFSINHPTKNMVTFDGLTRNGIPYRTDNATAKGTADILTSKPINLEALGLKDSLYLSFYWQIQGLGEQADLSDNDSLLIEGKDRAGKWNIIWFTTEVIENYKAFKNTLIAIKNSDYFHPNFQFRFRSVGRLSGAYDTWNIDYVYLNKSRNYKDLYTKDVACRGNLSPLLKRYFQMPIRQFLANPIQETATSIKTEIYNLLNNNNFTQNYLSIQNMDTNVEYQRISTEASENIAALSIQKKEIKINPLLALTNTPTRIRYKFQLITTDDQFPSIPSINLQQNDSISAVCTLDKTFAYDDGIAESAGSLFQKNTRVAIRFIANIPDVLEKVQLYFPQIYYGDDAQTTQSTENKSFILQVWSAKNGLPSTLLHSQYAKVKYSKLNEFIDFPLEKQVSVRDTFFVGWMNMEEGLMAVGLDKNYDFTENIVYNFGNGQPWVSNQNLGENKTKGNYMLRAVMGERSSNTLLNIQHPSHSSFIFPNPTSGIVHWETTLAVKSIYIYDSLGRLVRFIPNDSSPLATYENPEFDISELTKGVYFVHFKLVTGDIHTERLLLSK